MPDCTSMLHIVPNDKRSLMTRILPMKVTSELVSILETCIPLKAGANTFYEVLKYMCEFIAPYRTYRQYASL